MLFVFQAVRKLQRVFETEVKGKGRRTVSSRDLMATECEEFMSPVDCNPDSNLWYLDSPDVNGISSDTQY